MSYLDSDYDVFFQRQLVPEEKENEFSDFSFVSENLDNIIDSKLLKIQNVNLENGSLIIGGADNKQKIIIRDDSNNEVGYIDNTGLVLNNGKFTFKTEDGQDFLTKDGLFAPNFIETGILSKKSNQTFAGDYEFQTVNELTHTFNTKKQCVGIYFATLACSVSGTDAQLFVRYFINNNVYLPVGFGQTSKAEYMIDTEVDAVTNMHYITAPFTQIFEPGNHTVALQAARGTPDETVTIRGWEFGSGASTLHYILLGRV